MKMKHNKKRNTAFLYECLIKELTKTIVRKEIDKKEKIVEDAKGVQTTDFKIKMKLMKAVNNIEIKISKKK